MTDSIWLVATFHNNRGVTTCCLLVFWVTSWSRDCRNNSGTCAFRCTDVSAYTPLDSLIPWNDLSWGCYCNVIVCDAPHPGQEYSAATSSLSVTLTWPVIGRTPLLYLFALFPLTVSSRSIFNPPLSHSSSPSFPSSQLSLTLFFVYCLSCSWAGTCPDC